MQGQASTQRDQEVNQDEGRGESQVRTQQSPPQPFIDLAQVINNQTLCWKLWPMPSTAQGPANKA